MRDLEGERQEEKTVQNNKCGHKIYTDQITELSLLISFFMSSSFCLKIYMGLSRY